MPLTKSNSRDSRGSHRNSGSGFHPFGGRVSRHFGDSTRGHQNVLCVTELNGRGVKRTFKDMNFLKTLFDSKSASKVKASTTRPVQRAKIPAMANKRRFQQLSPDDAYLSYHDVRLTREDVDTIKNDWLTDNAIAFWEEYLEHEKLRDYPKANIVLLRPSMSFMLMNSKDPLSLKSALPDFAKTSHIFLPVNDCRDVTAAEGGSHWSLLLVSVIDGVAFHYDSMAPSNLQEAKLVAHRISQLLGKPLKFINLDDSPQQENGMDCGVYVCLLMQHLLMTRLLRAHAQDKVSMSMRGKEVDAAGGRREMLRIIEVRRKEGERRRSRSHSRSPFENGKSRSPPRIGDENAD